METVQTYFKTKPYRSEKYKKFIRSKPCLTCGSSGSEHHHESLSGGGTGTKCPDNESLPLCFECHNERHHIGRDTFFEKHELDYEVEVLKFQHLYERRKTQ